jgi:hypothetical protein
LIARTGRFADNDRASRDADAHRQVLRGRGPLDRLNDLQRRPRIFVSARIPPTLFRIVKGYAGTNGRKVQDVVEEALTEYLANRR